MTDFEPQLPLSISGEEIRAATKKSEFSNFQPEIIKGDELKLKPLSDEDLVEFPGQDASFITELRENRVDLQFFIDNNFDGKRLFLKRPKQSEDESDYLIALRPGFSKSSWYGAAICEDMYLQGNNSQLISVKSLFPDADNLMIDFNLMMEAPDRDARKTKIQSLRDMDSFVGFTSYGRRNHSFNILETINEISIPGVCHEAGHAWVYKLGLLKDDESGRVHLDSEEEWEKIDELDGDLFKNIRNQKTSERLASFLGMRIAKKFEGVGFKPMQDEELPGERYLSEFALSSYDVTFAYALIKYADHFGIDPRLLFYARENRTEEGIERIRKLLSFSSDIHGSLRPLVDELLKSKMKPKGDDWNEPYRREYRSGDGNIKLKVSITKKDRFLQAELTNSTDIDNPWRFEWSPHLGVEYSNKDRHIEALPGVKTECTDKDFTLLEEKSKQVKSILSSINKSS